MNSKRTKPLWLALITVLLVGILSACGSSENSANEAGPSNGGSASSNEERVVKHALGEKTIKGTPQRVVVLTNEGTEAMLALGVKPVGAVKSWTGDPWYPHIKDQMEGVTVLGEESQPNIELIAELQPARLASIIRILLPALSSSRSVLPATQ